MSSTPPMEDEKVNHISVEITIAATASEVQLRQWSYEGFQEVKAQLQSLVNAVLENVS